MNNIVTRFMIYPLLSIVHKSQAHYIYTTIYNYYKLKKETTYIYIYNNAKNKKKFKMNR